MTIDALHDLHSRGIQDMRTGFAGTFHGMARMRGAATHEDVRALVDGGFWAIHAAMEAFDGILKRHGAEKDETPSRALAALAEVAAERMDGAYARETLRDLAIVKKACNVASYSGTGFPTVRHQAEALVYDEDARALSGDAAPSGEDDPSATMDRVEAALPDRMVRAA